MSWCPSKSTWRTRALVRSYVLLGDMKRIMKRVFDMFPPEAIVMQCGSDSLSSYSDSLSARNASALPIVREQDEDGEWTWLLAKLILQLSTVAVVAIVTTWRISPVPVCMFLLLACG
jgi:hypothetical protein